MVHTKIFFWDFDNDSYAQNSEIILTIRIQKNFFKIPIGKFFEKLSKSKKKICVYHICGILYHICGSKLPHMWYTIPHMWYIVYHVCGIVYHICGSFDPQMWYTIPHMWYTQKYFFGILTMIPMPKIQKLF